MKPSEMRARLLREHAELRAIADEARSAAERCLHGERTGDRLREILDRLAECLRAHNAHEEHLMREVVPLLDAWGPARASVMLDEHVREHKELYAALVDVHTDGVQSHVASTVLDLVQQLAAHMVREEKVFLSEEVLDDLTLPDCFGG